MWRKGKHHLSGEGVCATDSLEYKVTQAAIHQVKFVFKTCVHTVQGRQKEGKFQCFERIITTTDLSPNENADQNHNSRLIFWEK